jgi:hypothetical protein
MKQSINVYQFRDEFAHANRSDNFSYEGLAALFDYLEDLEDSIGEEMELDVIALCCDFSEYTDLNDVVSCYDIQLDDDSDEDERAQQVIEWLQERTTVIEFDDGIIIQDF